MKSHPVPPAAKALLDSYFNNAQKLKDARRIAARLRAKRSRDAYSKIHEVEKKRVLHGIPVHLPKMKPFDWAKLPEEEKRSLMAQVPEQFQAGL